MGTSAPTQQDSTADVIQQASSQNELANSAYDAPSRAGLACGSGQRHDLLRVSLLWHGLGFSCLPMTGCALVDLWIFARSVSVVSCSCDSWGVLQHID